MKLHQLSLFLENKASQMTAPVRKLGEAGIDILTLTLADTEQFGILRLIVKEWENAKNVLEKEGCVVNVAEVLAIEINDTPGGLADVLESIDELGLNIEYMYAFTFGRGNKAILIFRFEDVDAAIPKLQSKGVNVIGDVELYEHIQK